MIKIFSNIEKDKLLHIVNRLSEIPDNRTDLAEPNEFLQLSTLKLKNGKTFYPHKHIWKTVENKSIAQESWIVIKGSVKAILYDLDDTIIATPILKAGDCSITFFGGHNYLILEDDSIIYEVKTGPYFGVEFDKVPISHD